MENDDKDKISINEKEAKKQFFAELKSKNLEEEKKLEELKKEKAEEKKKKAEEKKRQEELKKKEAEEKKKQEELQKKETEEKKKQEELQKKEAEEKVKTEDKEEPYKELIKGKDNFSKEEEIEKPVKSLKVNQKLKASIIDTIVTGVVSVAALYLFDLILRLLAGYYIADMKGMFIIIFLIVLVLYPFVMDKTKYRATLGDKFSKEKE